MSGVSKFSRDGVDFCLMQALWLRFLAARRHQEGKKRQKKSTTDEGARRAAPLATNSSLPHLWLSSLLRGRRRFQQVESAVEDGIFRRKRARSQSWFTWRGRRRGVVA